MSLSKQDKDKIVSDRKKDKPELEVEVNDDGSVYYFEDAAHVAKRAAQKEQSKVKKG